VPLSAGSRVGAYEVVGPLGAGGMGEVYRARDSKLNREVALKLLPEAFSQDESRVARFTRESHVLASLNHPNIGAIYGVEDSGGSPVLVLELIEGPTLAELLKAGALPIPEALAIARQIAESLQAAHDAGVVHRDLKPSNIKVRPDGTVKVLDFGLAKALDPAGAAADLSQSPTWTPADWTHPGTIMGTAAYMSPEQAAGRLVDRRTDLWSFGVVLMEMLTGRLVFNGETATHVLAAVLREEPDFASLPRDTPEPLRRLLRRCLEKSPKRRLDSAHAARLDIDEAVASPDPAGVPARSRVAGLPLLAAALGGAALATLLWTTIRPAADTVPRPLTRFVLTPPAELPFEPSLQAAARDFALASDGSFIVYATSDGRLALRRFDQLETTTVAGATSAVMPFLSPDNQWIGFVEDNLSLKKVPVGGGSPITLARLPVWPRGASWVDDNTIVIGTNSETTGLLRVPAGGGEPVVLTTPDRGRGEEGHLLPFRLPGARAVLFTVGAEDPKKAQVAVLDLETRRRTTVLEGARDAQYLASGHLLYQTGVGMSAARFDLAGQKVVGQPLRLIENLAVAPTASFNAAATDTGALVYVMTAAGPGARRSLVWIDREGRETPVGAPARAYESARLSPDGASVAVGIRDQENDIWTWSIARQTLTRLTVDADVDLSPVWTPDGRRIVFSSARTGVYNLYALDVQRAGADVRLTRGANTQLPDSVTADGGFVILHEVRPVTRSGIDRVALPSGLTAAGAAERLIDGPFDEWNGEVSPDGSLISFQSGDSGHEEVYICPYPDVNRARWQVSSGGGREPAWVRGGRELAYIDGTGSLAAVGIVRAGDDVRVESRTVIAARVSGSVAAWPWRTYDVSADGRRFLVIRGEGAAAQTSPLQFTVVQNWFDELSRLLPSP
jgi:eukaryotic-like serine/threonine-protein kinase